MTASVFSLFLYITFCINVSAQDCLPLICNQDLNISLNLACELQVTPDMLLEDPDSTSYTIQLFDQDENFIRSDYLLAEDVGQSLKYLISCENNSCWGSIVISSAIVPTLDALCQIDENDNLSDDCILVFVENNESLPSQFISVQELTNRLNECGPELLGDIEITETRSGDICSPEGEIVSITYSGKLVNNGTITNQEFLTQSYQLIKIDIDPDFIFFPDDVLLDIDYLDGIGTDSLNLEFGSPSSIEASGLEASLAYPYFLNPYDSIYDVIRFIDTMNVVVDSIARDTMVRILVDGVERLVQKTIVDYIYEAVTYEWLDTIGKTNPIVPIDTRISNAIARYTDIGINDCDSGTHILREWTVIDWCDQSLSISDFQRIAIIDIEEFIFFNISDELIIMDTIQVDSILFDSIETAIDFDVFPVDTIQIDSIIFDTILLEIDSTIDFETYDENLFTFFELEGNEDLIQFPRDITLDCDYIDVVASFEELDTLILGAPETIELFTEDFETAFPVYLDTSFVLPDIVKICDTNDVVVEFILRDTLINEIIDGKEAWTVLTLVDEIYGEEIDCTFDTIGTKFFADLINNLECSIMSSYSDVVIAGCGNSMNIERTWQLVDWLNTSVILTEIQNIEILDNSAPAVITRVNGQEVTLSTLDDITVSIDPWSCSATLAIPTLDIVDNCDPNPKIEWQSDNGSITDGNLNDLLLSTGPTKLTGTLYDDCNNQSEVSFNVIVVDSLQPVAICKGFLQVSLTNTIDELGEAKISAASLNEGSHDSGCGKIVITAVRKDDWTDFVRDCRDIVQGYAPRSCNAFTEEIDLVENADIEDCKFLGTTTTQITKPSEYVRFCCEDFNKIVEVILFVEDEFGNIGQCLVKVEVLDESTPIILCEDLVINCDSGQTFSVPIIDGIVCPIENPWQIELLAESETTNNKCGGQNVIREWFIDFDQSGDYTATDPYCKQEVVVVTLNEFDPNSILWPRHIDGTIRSGVRLNNYTQAAATNLESVQLPMKDILNCFSLEIDQEPVWCDTDCGLISMTVENDTIFNFGGNCLELQKHWTIIDWCLFDFRDIESEQSTDSVIPVISNIEEHCGENNINIQDSIYLKYTDLVLDGVYSYTQTILIQDTIPPRLAVQETSTVFLDEGIYIEGDSRNCSGIGTIYASATEQCGLSLVKDFDLIWEIIISDGEEVLKREEHIGNVVSIETPRGNQGDQFFVTWIVNDACGNETVKESKIIFNDFREPTPVCIPGLTKNFAANSNTVTVFAEEYNFKSFDNCTERSLLRYSIVEAGEQAIRPGSSGFSNQESIQFKCDDSPLIRELDMYVWDGSGNGSFCRVGIALIDDDFICENEDDEDDESDEDDEEDEDDEDDEEDEDDENDERDESSSGTIIAGQVQTSSGVHVDDVQVTISSPSLREYPLSTNTNNQGAFIFLNNPENFNYSLTASKGSSDFNDISTLDLVIITRHILNLQTMDNPFNIIAADVSGDMTVSAEDLNELRRYILGESDGFAINRFWSFIDSRQLFFNMTNPWPFNESIIIRDNTEHLLEENFVGVKFGDVNNSFGNQETRSLRDHYFEIDDISIHENNEYRIDIRSLNQSALHGFQFNISHPGIVIKDVFSGALKMTEDNWHTKNGNTSMLWYASSTQSVDVDKPLFSLIINSSIQENKLSDVMTIQKDRITAEAYLGNSKDVYPLGLQFIDQEKPFELFQNHPNPFKESTNITFKLNEEGDIKLNIYNSLGAEIFELSKHFSVGKHSVQLDEILNGQSGVLFYILEMGNMREVRKMIKLGNAP